MNILLPNLEATDCLGQILASAVNESSRLLPIFFFGELGMGKTTLISALVKALPGGNEAETSSPSFTLCNIYPTTPSVAHFDAYRQENDTVDESLLDFLDGERHLVLVEWAERLPEYAFPPQRLHCEITSDKDIRKIQLSAFGPGAERFLDVIQSALDSGIVSSVSCS